MSITKWSIAFCSFFYSISLIAQNNFLQFENHDFKNGLSQNSGYCLTQDKTGYMWFGTQDGLNRYDGYDIKVFRKTVSPNSLPDNYISALVTDNLGNIWIGTPNGLCIYCLTTNKIETFKSFNGLEYPLNYASIINIKKDSRNNIWIFTSLNGLFLYTSNKKIIPIKNSQNIISLCEDNKGDIWLTSINKIFLYKNQSKSIVNANIDLNETINIRDIACINNELWVATFNKGLTVFTIKNKILKLRQIITSATVGFGINSNEITCLLKDANNNLWIGTRNSGIYLFDSKKQKVFRGYHNENPNSLEKNFVLSLFEDRQGLIWVGLSGGGVAKYDPNRFKFEFWEKFSPNQQLPQNDMAFCIKIYNHKQLYIGTQSSGLVKFDLKTKLFTVFKTTENVKSIIHNSIYGIAKDDAGKIWLATWGGLCSYNPEMGGKLAFQRFTSGSDKIHTNLYTILKISGQNKLLIGGVNGLYFFDINKKNFLNVEDHDGFATRNKIVVRMMIEDNTGIIWLATEGLGLLKYSIEDNEITQIKIHDKSDHFTVRDILPADSVNLWLGTDDGLIMFNKQTQKTEKWLTQKTGLLSEVIYSMEKDNNDGLWFSSNMGISYLDLKTNIPRNYDLNDGIQSMEFNTACSFKDDDGIMYFGGINGVNRFNPKDINISNFNPTPVITNVKINDIDLENKKLVPNYQHLTMSPEQNFAKIDFSTLNFSNTEKNVYKYRLNDFDRDWVFSGTAHSVNYTKLPAGNYTFQVKAANGDGVWSKNIASISFSIAPQWYQSWWFICPIIILTGFLVFSVFFYRIREIRKASIYKQKISESELVALRAQMNPHFIFNSINSIDSFIQINDKYNASNYLNKFAKLIRNVLESSKSETIPFWKDIETLKMYVEMEAMRNDYKFKCEFLIDEHLLRGDYKVPSLIVQPYVENAILHGLRNKENGEGLLKIEIKEEENILVYSIRDNGVGRKATENWNWPQHKSMGTALSKERIALFNKQKDGGLIMIDLYDENNHPTGTEVIVKLRFS